MPRDTKKTRSWCGELVQLAGLVLLGAGITLELIHQAAVWLTLITVGSIIFAVGTKLKGR